MRGWVKLMLLLAGLMAMAGQAAALDGKMYDVVITSPNIPTPVPATIYTPPGYDPKRADPYPLLIQLHGGGGSNKAMAHMGPLLEQAIKEGRVPPMVSIMPSAGRSFYMDFRDGSQKWEQFVTKDLVAYSRQNLNVPKDRKGTFITGISMGGMGSLRMAFKHPEMFQAVASQEPGIEPALAWDDIQLRDRYWRSDALMEQIYGKPVDKAYWAANNPATIANKDPERLVGLGIYLEADDQDMFFLQHGTEFVHRILFDHGIAHEYRLVRGAEHVGPSIDPRFLDAMTFIGRQINPPHWVDDQVKKTRAMLDGQKKAIGYPVVPVDPERIRMK